MPTSSLSNKIAKLPTTNRFRLTRLHEDEVRGRRRLRWGIWNRPKIDMTQYYVYELQERDIGRLDRVAYEFYGKEELWWAIASVNNIKNPFSDVVPGAQILVPLETSIERALAEGNEALFD